jgi:L-ascorbate metabolism protein UlaG (beta-lactamase superfamily)
MVLNYFGEGCFRLQSGELSVLVNPTSNRLKADVTLKTIVSPEEHPSPDEIAFPGEYESKGIEIQGWQLTGESTEKFLKTVFQVTWEEMRFVFLGHLSGPLPNEIIEELGEPDLVFVPTGDDHFIPAPDAAKLMKQLEPKIIVPAYYKNSTDLEKAMGVKAEREEKFVFKKKDIADAKSRLIVLESKS